MSEIISPSALHPGDIFLLEYQAFEDGKRVKFPAIGFLNLVYNLFYEEEKNWLKGDHIGDFIQWSITAVDDNRYYHAAFWDGEAVIETGPGGVSTSDNIDAYSQHHVDVFRFIPTIETPPLYPTEALQESGKRLVEISPEYGYFNASLLAILCLERRSIQPLLDTAYEYAASYLDDSSRALLDLLWQSSRAKIVNRFNTMLINLLVGYRDEGGMVCSELVAAIYNMAIPAGHYHVAKPEVNTLLMAENTGKEYWAIDDTATFASKLQKVLETAETSELLIQCDNTIGTRLLSEIDYGDILYTPNDFATSPEMRFMGRLQVN